MKRKFTLALICCFAVFLLKAQNTPVVCGEEGLLARQLTNHPEILARHLAIESQLYNDTRNGLNHHDSKSGNVLYVLPVVVHIIHNNGTENISDAQVIQGIEDLNEAYANMGYYDSTTGVSIQVQFCLAKRDPANNITSGITRDVSALTYDNMDNDDLALKNLNRWDPNCYVNIWLVKSICTGTGSCNIGGYAYFPSSAGTPYDGLVCLASYFGSSKARSVVQIHEMGHYLGLYHTFQGGCTNNDCLADGDKVCDTPPDNSTAYYQCGAVVNTCTTDALSGFNSDQNDLYEDYMDYGNFNCMNRFTQGQKDRMLWTMANIRTQLPQCPSCLSPCTNPTSARFTASNTNVTVGTAVTFTNTSGNSTSYNWYINGTQFSTATSPSYTFNTIGTYIIKLQANNSDPNCSSDFMDTIIVACTAVAGFTQSAYNLAVNQVDTFTNTSTNATTYQWFIDGVMVSGTTNFTHSFTQSGDYSVYLVASNSMCADTTSIFNFIHVGSNCNAYYTYTPAHPNSCGPISFIPDTTCNYSNYYWSFCEQDSLGQPSVTQYNTLPYGSGQPTGSLIYKDGQGNYFGFFGDYYNNTDSTRFYMMDYGQSMADTPVIKKITVTGITDPTNHSISIIEVNGIYYAFLLSYYDLWRVKIGPDLHNTHWTAVQVGNLNNLIQWGHMVQVVRETNNYWLVISNRNTANILIGYLGNNIENNPVWTHTYTDGLGNSSFFYFCYVRYDGRNYVFALDFHNGIIRYDFGNSLANTPTTHNLGMFGSGLPLGISIFENCDGSFDGYLFKEDMSDHKILHFDSITARPVIKGTLPNSIGYVGGVSPFIITDKGITTLLAEGDNKEVALLTYGSCIATNAYSFDRFPPPVSFTTPGPHYVRLIVDQGLPSESTYCDEINVDSVDTHPLNLGPDTAICYTGSAILHAGPWYQSYLWNNGYADSTFTAYQPGQYWVRVTDYCGHVFTDTVNVTVDSSTQITLPDTTICLKTSAQLNGPAGYGSYHWLPSAGVACPTCRNTTATPDTTTVYSLQAITGKGCMLVATQKVTVIVCEPVSELAAGIGLEFIRPNPAHDKITVGLAGVPGKLEVHIFDALGQQAINSLHETLNAGSNHFDIDISGLATGIYFIELQHENGARAISRLVKE
ncbi:MAG TPA: M43 family zinc metalloprotease [Chitinophagales bacterium]|nr:M43 family zinc metalloprotease [Chitinophagales bacterium]